MKKNCCLQVVEETNKKTGKSYKSLYLELPSGLRFQVRYSFYNYKLAYRVEQELKEQE